MLEQFLAMFWMLFALFFISFTVGSLSSMLAGLDTKEKLLISKLEIIDEFAKDAHLNIDLKQRLRKALKYSTEQQGYSLTDKQNILNEIPRHLRYELSLEMHRGAVKTLPFFTSKDEVFVAAIVPFLRDVFIDQGSLFFSEGEYADEIYFLVKGRANYIQRNGVIYKSIQEGSYFGEIEVLRGIDRKYTIKAANDCDIMIMGKDLVKIIENEFPLVAKQMKDIAETRDKANQKAKLEMKEILKVIKSRNLNVTTLKEIKANADTKQKRQMEMNEKNDKLKHEKGFDVKDVLKSLKIIEDRVNRLTEEISDAKEVARKSYNEIREKFELQPRQHLFPIRVSSLMENPMGDLHNHSLSSDNSQSDAPEEITFNMYNNSL